MSDTFHRPIAQRARALLARVPLADLITCAALVAALSFVNPGAPGSWWPRTGQAFAATPSPQPALDREDDCAYIVGPARDFCLRGSQTPQAQTPAPSRPPVLHAALLLLPVATIAARRRRTK
ncbi:hypothetical protein [Streptomyces sp. WAC01280]|uniref:hypothetical protein n=1 Tax=Streptomyces sp. WAC01280 TaxID=2487424 RepID=UPI000F7A152C|nr:hypothetical protein [Streptomyces sp. WAC01280]RSS57492.1 hypothetical protein EF909_16270 [Streptomyces sp. WAC01280]